MPENFQHNISEKSISGSLMSLSRVYSDTGKIPEDWKDDATIQEGQTKWLTITGD